MEKRVFMVSWTGPEVYCSILSVYLAWYLFLPSASLLSVSPLSVICLRLARVYVMGLLPRGGNGVASVLPRTLLRFVLSVFDIPIPGARTVSLTSVFLSYLNLLLSYWHLQWLMQFICSIEFRASLDLSLMKH